MSASAEKELIVTRTPEQGANAETSVTFVPTPFAKGKKKELGIKYPAFPVVSAETLDIARNFFGDENFFSMLNNEIRLWIQQTYNAVVEVQGGEFDESLFIKYVTELSTRGETKDEIEQALAKLRTEMLEVLAKSETATTDAEKLQYLGEFQEISKKVKKYSALLESKKRVPRAAKEEEEDNASANS